MAEQTVASWPTRAQVLDALDQALDDRGLDPHWRGVLHGLREGLERLMGVQAVLDPLRAQCEQLERDLTSGPGAGRHAGIVFGAGAALGRVDGLWKRDVYVYGRRAHVALQAVAAGIRPPLYPESLPGAGAEDVPPEIDEELPEGLAGADVSLIRRGLLQLRLAEEAAEGYEEMGEYHDEEGHRRHSIPEHLMDEADELDREMNRWPEYLGDYADAVVYTLATELRGRMAAVPIG